MTISNLPFTKKAVLIKRPENEVISKLMNKCNYKKHIIIKFKQSTLFDVARCHIKSKAKKLSQFFFVFSSHQK